MKFEVDQLVSECLKGNPKARKHLYEQFAPQMYSVCMRYARCREDADDIFQQAFLTVFEKLSQLRDHKALAGWIKTIFVNTSLEYGRKHYKNDKPVNDFSHFEINHFDVNSVVSKMALDELTALIRQLPEQYKRVFNLYIIDGYSHKEIAEKLGITVGTSKSNLHDARSILKVQIAKLEMTVSEPLQKQK